MTIRIPFVALGADGLLHPDHPYFIDQGTAKCWLCNFARQDHEEPPVTFTNDHASDPMWDRLVNAEINLDLVTVTPDGDLARRQQGRVGEHPLVP